MVGRAARRVGATRRVVVIALAVGAGTLWHAVKYGGDLCCGGGSGQMEKEGQQAAGTRAPAHSTTFKNLLLWRQKKIRLLWAALEFI